jgi:hypothetical protein
MGGYHNTPPTPSQEGRVERQGTVVENAGRHFIILNSAFLTLNSLAIELAHPRRGYISIEAAVITTL